VRKEPKTNIHRGLNGLQKMGSIDLELQYVLKADKRIPGTAHVKVE
jgi:hypothetical protein